MGGNGEVLVDFYVRFRVDLSLEVPVVEFSGGSLGFPYYGYEYAFSIWEYDTRSGEPVRNLLYRNMGFSVFVILLETDPELEKVWPGPLTSLDPLLTYGDNGTVSLHWVSREALNARTAEGLNQLRSRGEKFVEKGVLELVGKNIPLKLSIDDLDETGVEGVSVKFYGGVMLWSMPGGSSPGGTSLIAWSSSSPLVIHATGSETTTTTSTPTSTGTSASSGLEKNLEHRTFVYDMSISYEFRHYIGGEETSSEWANAHLKHKISLGGLDQGYIDINGTVEDLEIEGGSPEAESLIREQLDALNFENRIHVSEITIIIKSLVESYTEFETRYQLEGLNYRVESTLYKGVPAIKISIYGEGSAYLSGAEEAYYNLSLTAYYDEYMGIPLETKSRLMLKAKAGDEVAEGSISFSSTIIGGIEGLPRINVKPGVIVGFQERQGVLKLTAENAEIRDLDVSGDTLTMTISGVGVGTLLVELPGDIYVEYVTVDGELVDYIVMADTPKKTVILIPVTLSQHMLSISFSEAPSGARITRISAGEEYTTTSTLTQAETTTTQQTQTTATTNVQPTKTTTAGETKTPTGTEGSTSPTGTVNPPDPFSSTWLYTIIAIIVVAILGSLVAVLRRRRKPKQPYYYPPAPPPPPPPR